MPTPNEDQPSSPWRSDYWPSQLERVRARREIAKMRQVLAAKSRHPSAGRTARMSDQREATG